MQIANRSGARFEVVAWPAAQGLPVVPAPFASPESFLASFTPRQQAALLRSLGAVPRFPGVEPALLRGIQTDDHIATLLSRFVRARHLAFRPVDLPASERRPSRTRPIARRQPTTSGGASAPSPAPPPPPPPPKVQEAPECELMAVAAACAHGGRKASREGVLEVVPGRSDDLIKLTSQIRGGCGKHTRWEVRSPFSDKEVKTGVESSFVAKSWGFKLLGIFEAQPKSYHVTALCCSGAHRSLEVRAYPIDEWEISGAIDLTTSPHTWPWEVKVTPWQDTSLTLKTDVLKKLDDRSAKMKYALDKMLKPLVGNQGEWKFFKTKLKFSGKWAEYPKDHRAFYKYTASVDLDPLLKGTFLIPFGPTAAIPAWIKKWTTDLVGDLYLYLKFEGELKLSGKWTRETPDETQARVEGSGKISVKMGGSLFLMKKGAVNLDVNGGTSITAECKAPVSRKPAVEYDVKWGGLEVELTIEAAWGLVEYKRKWKPIEGCSLLEKMLGHKPEPWYPFGQ